MISPQRISVNNKLASSIIFILQLLWALGEKYNLLHKDRNTLHYGVKKVYPMLKVPQNFQDYLQSSIIGMAMFL